MTCLVEVKLLAVEWILLCREAYHMPSAGPNPEQYRVDPNRPEFKRPRPEETDLMMKREMASR